MGWEVFLPVGFSDRVVSKIHELARALAEVRVEGGGLMSGAAGLACFHANYADWTGDLHFEELAADMLEIALNPAAGYFNDLRFSDGLAGILWTIDYLIREDFLAYDASSLFAETDHYLSNAMLSEMNCGHYDYLHGALGYALYFMHDPTYEPKRRALAELTAILREKAIIDGEGIRWPSVLDEKKGIKGVNLSLSHGMASIIILLSMIRKIGVETDLCDEMIRGGLRFINGQKLAAGQHISFFPSWAKESHGEIKGSRLAWCYGDIGIGLGYLSAGKQLPGEDFYSRGLDILLKTCKRQDLQTNSVHDAGICHGAAGLALIYNGLFQETKMEQFSHSAMYWLDVCLNMAGHKDGIGGYKAWFHPQYGGWKSTPGLLEGAAGIGLVMLSFVSGREAGWSKSLLLNL